MAARYGARHSGSYEEYPDLRPTEQGDNLILKRPEPRPWRNHRATEMEWEEALVGAWGGETPPHSAAYYRRKAARARQIAEGVTTRAMKARLLDEAVHCDRLAADADCGEGEAAGL